MTNTKDLLGIPDENKFLGHHRQWVDDALSQDSHKRESRWTESVAVGSREFVEQAKEQLGFRAKGTRRPSNYAKKARVIIPMAKAAG